jgi:hypothetical protein
VARVDGYCRVCHADALCAAEDRAAKAKAGEGWPDEGHTERKGYDPETGEEIVITRTPYEMHEGMLYEDCFHALKKRTDYLLERLERVLTLRESEVEAAAAVLTLAKRVDRIDQRTERHGRPREARPKPDYLKPPPAEPELRADLAGLAAACQEEHRACLVVAGEAWLKELKAELRKRKS